MKKILSVLLAAAMVMALSACGGSKYEPTESGIFVKRDGTVIDAAIETFDKDHYSKDELKSYVEEQVVAYNTENSSYTVAYQDDVKDKDAVLPVAIDCLEVNGDKKVATLLLKFAGVSDYLGFNEGRVGEDAYFVSALATQAMLKGEVNWIQVKDNQKVDEATALSNEKYYLVGLDFEARVEVEGTIVYASDNVSVLTGSVFTTDGEEPGYVVYKK